jgi:tellurite resistance protein TerC
VEKSLSVDNVFVFAIILTQFAVPSIYQQRVLLIGVVLALIFRAVFIAVGAVALAYFAFTFVIFGAILIWTGFGLMRHWNEDPDPSDNFVVKFVKRRFPYTDSYHGTKLFVKEKGVRVVTPMFIVMIAIASTDLLFALDSIPATFGITQEPFLVFSVNAFALLGLRALYFLIKGLLDRLIYLSLGLSFILIFIGIKLVLLFGYETFGSVVPKIETSLSLIVIAGILIVSIVASLIKSRTDPTAIAHAGRVTAPKKDKEHHEKYGV